MVRIAEHGTRRLIESQEDAAGMEHPIGQLFKGKRVRVKSYRIIWVQRTQLFFIIWGVLFFIYRRFFRCSWFTRRLSFILWRLVKMACV